MMTMTYIGDLNDPKFKWENDDWNGNIPHRLSPEFPGGNRSFNLIIGKIQKGEFDGKQVDWGAFVARVDKAQIIEFANELYKNNDLHWLNKDIKEFEKYIARLEENKLYALVACELY